MKKKQKRKIKKSIVLLFTSGITLFFLQAIYNRYISEPVAWMRIDDGDKIYFKENEDTGKTEIKSKSNTINSERAEVIVSEKGYCIEYEHEASVECPQKIILAYSRSIFHIFENSFIMNLNIANRTDNELMLNDLKFLIKQYEGEFPIIWVKSYIEDNEFKVDIHNATDKKINGLTVCLKDNSDKLKQNWGSERIKTIGPIEKDGVKTITLFELEEICDDIDTIEIIEPYITVSDENGNTMTFDLGILNISWDIDLDGSRDFALLPDADLDVPLASYEFSYDLTTDVVLKSEEISLNGVRVFVPAHTTVSVDISFGSDVPCLFEIQPVYKLNNNEFFEDITDIVIYNPDNKEDSSDYMNKEIGIYG